MAETILNDMARKIDSIGNGDEGYGEATKWNFDEAGKVIAAAVLQRDIVMNGVSRILAADLSTSHEDNMKAVMMDLNHIHENAAITGPGQITQRLAVVLKMFLDDNDFRKGEGDLDNIDCDEIREARTLLEMLS